MAELNTILMLSVNHNSISIVTVIFNIIHGLTLAAFLSRAGYGLIAICFDNAFLGCKSGYAHISLSYITKKIVLAREHHGVDTPGIPLYAAGVCQCYIETIKWRCRRGRKEN
jgi:hypothetical protein